MKIDLKNYLDSLDKIREYEKSPGPFVTISRAYGCDVSALTKELIKRIAEESIDSKNQNWKLVSKEILDEVGKELKINPVYIENLMGSSLHSQLVNMFVSFAVTNAYGISEKKILDALKDVLHLYANKGKSIIIGRGGAFMTDKVPNSLHIRLHAPFEWRVDKIQNKYKITKSQAITMVREMDEKRKAWIEHVNNGIVDETKFDLIINRESIPEEMIIETIMSLLKTKEMINHSTIKELTLC